MNYNELKIRAYKMVDDLYEKGTKRDVIVYNVQKEYGFGGTFVDERIKILDAVKE